MLYSSACEYAIRALTRLARQGDGELSKLRGVAEAEDVPYPFLASIFQRLVNAGLLTSARGPTGGYALSRPASEVTLFEIKALIDGVDDLEQCAVGLARCSDTVPCPLHDTFKPIRGQIRRYLETTTVADMAAAVEQKRAALGTPHTSSGPPAGGDA